MEKHINILILDDNRSMLETLKDILGAEGYDVVTVDSLEAAGKISARSFIIWSWLTLSSRRKRLGFIKRGQESQPGHDGDNIYRLCLFRNRDYRPAGRAFGYLHKPLNIEELKIMIKKALKAQALSLENKSLIVKLKKLSLKDPQTGLYNYRYLMERLSSEFKGLRGMSCLYQ